MIPHMEARLAKDDLAVFAREARLSHSAIMQSFAAVKGTKLAQHTPTLPAILLATAQIDWVALLVVAQHNGSRLFQQVYGRSVIDASIRRSRESPRSLPLVAPHLWQEVWLSPTRSQCSLLGPGFDQQAAQLNLEPLVKALALDTCHCHHRERSF